MNMDLLKIFQFIKPFCTFEEFIFFIFFQKEKYIRFCFRFQKLQRSRDCGTP